MLTIRVEQTWLDHEVMTSYALHSVLSSYVSLIFGSIVHMIRFDTVLVVSQKNMQLGVSKSE
jgi:hypothetical protein